MLKDSRKAVQKGTSSIAKSIFPRRFFHVFLHFLRGKQDCTLQIIPESNWSTHTHLFCSTKQEKNTNTQGQIRLHKVTLSCCMLMEGHCHKDTSLIPFRTAAVAKDLCICYRLENFLHGDSGIFLTLLKSFTNIV